MGSKLWSGRRITEGGEHIKEQGEDKQPNAAISSRQTAIVAVRPSLLCLALGEHVAPTGGALLKGSFELPAGVCSWHKPIPGGTSYPHSPKGAAQGWGLGDHPAQGHHLSPQKPSGDGCYCAPTAASWGLRNALMVGLDSFQPQ